MTTPRDPDEILAAWLDEGPTRLPDQTRRAITVALPTTSQRRHALNVPWGSSTMSTTRGSRKGRRSVLRFSMSRQLTALTAVAAAAIIIAGIAFLRPASLGDVGGPPTLTAVIPITWGPDAAVSDWPGPLRTEGPSNAALLYRVADYADALGDSDAPAPWADISHVTLRTGNLVQSSNPIAVDLAGGLSNVPHPTVSWIAYGVVVDLDGDGRPDQRIGIDNSVSDHREWITDLATGQTTANTSGVFGAFEAFGTRLETWFVDADGLVSLNVKRMPGGIRFYAWASVISDGRVVSTDFAPDTGWIETISP
jgi:hypothetical protein